MPHRMNPFDFVPLPQGGPRALSNEIIKETRYEGYIEYSIKVLTPLHITGMTEKDGDHFKVKHFNESYGKKVIPGSSIRGMLAAYIEAVTGSDLRSFTRGKEGKERRESGKWYEEDGSGRVAAEKCRHVGFLMAAGNDPNYRGLDHAKDPARSWRGEAHKSKEFHERRATLPDNFAMNKFDHEERDDDPEKNPVKNPDKNPCVDLAGFLFGYVPQEDEKDEKKKKNNKKDKPPSIPARSGRLIFEDVTIPGETAFVNENAWDIKGDASFGMPNPRASTAWYFTPGSNRMRTVSLSNGMSFSVWEVLADKARGRKFYYHQHPEACRKEYKAVNDEMQRALMALPENKRKNRKLPQLVAYDVEAVAPESVITGGRIDFRDLPKSLLLFLLYALDLNQDLDTLPRMAHKLGGLKPFGFGSVALTINKIVHRPSKGLPGPLNSEDPEGDIPKDIWHPEAFRCLQKIMHFPQGDESRDFVFVYPPFNPLGSNPEAKGFAMVERADSGGKGPTPGNSQKLTMFFDHYQKSADNCPKVWPSRR